MHKALQCFRGGTMFRTFTRNIGSNFARSFAAISAEDLRVLEKQFMPATKGIGVVIALGTTFVAIDLWATSVSQKELRLEVKEDILKLSTQVAELKADVKDLKMNVKELKTDMKEIKEALAKLTTK